MLSHPEIFFAILLLGGGLYFLRRNR